MVCIEKRFHPPDFNGLYHNIFINNDLRYFKPVSYGKSGMIGGLNGRGELCSRISQMKQAENNVSIYVQVD